MAERNCPDCKGEGRWFRPYGCRIVREVVYHPEISCTAVSITRRELPEWEPCVLCEGAGRVECTPI